jgi:ABC-type polysaccharide/polyol phosphate export permease
MWACDDLRCMRFQWGRLCYYFLYHELMSEHLAGSSFISAVLSSILVPSFFSFS